MLLLCSIFTTETSGQEHDTIIANEFYKKARTLGDAANYEQSILNYYRDIIRFRKQNPVLVYGDYECLLKEHPDLFVYRRWDETAEFLILHNMSDVPQNCPIEIQAGSFELCKTNILDAMTDLLYLSPWQTKILIKK